MKRPIAISDSANFYVSCERLFDPTLQDVPVSYARKLVTRDQAAV